MIHLCLRKINIKIQLESLIKICLNFIMLLEMVDLVRYEW